jgi:hypothetical protein
MKRSTCLRAAVVFFMMLPCAPAFAQKAPIATPTLDPARIAAAKELVAAKGGADALKRTVTELGAGPTTCAGWPRCTGVCGRSDGEIYKFLCGEFHCFRTQRA